MPRGPRGERRPADTIGCAVHVARIATREITEELDEAPPAPAPRGLSAGGQPQRR